MDWEIGNDVYILLIRGIKKITNENEWLRELYSVLCGDLNGKGIQKGDIWICIADPLCCSVETNMTL